MKVGLFLTFGYSLETWEKAGILDRELAIYESHYKKGIRTVVISYGGTNDELISKRYEFIEVVCNKWGLPTRIFASLIPYIFTPVFRDISIIKTNQMYGAHVALKCARRYKLPLYIRQGYSFFESQVGKYGRNSIRSKRARYYECKYLYLADIVAFSTKNMADYAIKRCGCDTTFIRILPNYIVEETWSPPWERISNSEIARIVFFGRFTAQKNLENLIQACVGLKVELVLIGEGPLRQKLEDLSTTLGVTTLFTGRLEQRDVVKEMRRCSFFVLPSHYEGHPKGLIEAMCFGIPVLATNCDGIRNEIFDGKTGILTSPSISGLHKGLQEMIDMTDYKRDEMVLSARSWVLERYSLNKIAESDLEMLKNGVSDKINFDYIGHTE